MFLKRNNLIIGITIIFSTLLIIWCSLDKAPLSGDSAGYAKESIKFYKSIKGESNLIDTYFNLLGRRKTPLIVILPTPAFFVLEYTNNITYILPNVIVLTITIPIFFLLVKEFFKKEIAILSVFILFTMPLAYGMSRRLLPDFFLMAFSIWWLYALVKSSHFKNRKWAIILGIVTGLGFMMKITFFSLIILPLVYCLFKRLNEKVKRKYKKIFVDITYVALPAIIIFAPWYSYNFKILLWQMKRSAFGDASLTTSLGPVFSPYTVFKYWGRISNYGISTYYTITGLLFILILLFKKKNKQIKFPLLLILFFITPFILQTFGGTKELRYITPALPVIAIFLSVFLYKLFSKFKYAKFLYIIYFTFPIFLFLYSSFSITELKNSYILGQLIFADSIGYPGHSVSKRPSSEWPNLEILKYIANNTSLKNTAIPITIIKEIEHLNAFSLEYYRYAYNLPFENIITKGSIGDTFITPSLETAYEQINSSEFLISIIGKEADPTLGNKFDTEINNKLLNNELPFKLVKEYLLPIGGVAIIFKRI